MPKRRKDDEAPRRRGAAVAAVAESDERGFAMRLLMSSPRDVIAGMFASAAVVAIISNAIFMQAGQHPSPMFGRSAASGSVSVVTLPRPRPEPRPETKTLDPALLEPSPTELKPSETKAADAKPVETRAAEPKHVDSKPDNRRVERTRTADADASDPLGSLVQRTTQPRAPAPAPAAAPSTASTAPRPPAAIPATASRDQAGDMISSSRRIAAVQRALTEYGYGQLKPTGNVGSDTQAAIQRFERARRLPVTGQVSDRLVRELGMVTGRSID